MVCVATTHINLSLQACIKSSNGRMKSSSRWPYPCSTWLIRCFQHSGQMLDVRQMRLSVIAGKLALGIASQLSCLAATTSRMMLSMIEDSSANSRDVQSMYCIRISSSSCRYARLLTALYYDRLPPSPSEPQNEGLVSVNLYVIF